MCALFGWLDYKGIVSDRLLKKLTQALANAAEERGTDASGIAYVKDGKVTIYKRPKPAHKLRFNAPNGTRAVMGHTRMTTQGNENFNYNNHPFYGHADVNFAFAHNGVLYNDKELRMEKHLPQTQIETDSYVAVQLLEQQSKLDFDSLKGMAELVQGRFCSGREQHALSGERVKSHVPAPLCTAGTLRLCLDGKHSEKGIAESRFPQVSV